ncbi:hypothetical protein ASF22_02730 [Methylobacterium sp. Leaf87]|nr:hypothetical protein ASF22_02730 [Methylobacterium sp. Leaf87]
MSRFYNDEGIGRGFQNIAGALAPPDASDQLAGQKALEIRDKGLRLAELYANTQDPQYDRRATLLGLQTGSQSLEAVGLNNATTRSTNAADNARAIQQEAMRQSGDTDRTMLAPVAQDATRFVPGRIAKMYGVPEQQYGSASLQPGEKVVRADGSELQGTPKPLSTDEVQAGAMQVLPANDLRSIIMGKAPVENVQTPDGPRVQYRDRAVGSAPAATPVTPQNATNYQTPDGKQGTAVLRDGVLMDSQTGQPIPAGSKQFSTAVQGGQDATGIGAANVNKAGQQLLDLDLADAAMDSYAQLLNETPGAQGALGAARRSFQDLVATGGEAGQVLQKQDAEVRRLVGENRFSPEVLQRFGGFDPKLSAVEGARQRAIALQAAASGGGAQVSNRDVERVEAEIGGGGLLANNSSSLANIAQAKRTNALVRSKLGVANPTAAGTFPGGGPAPSPAPAAPTAAVAEEWTRGPDGRPVRKN